MTLYFLGNTDISLPFAGEQNDDDITIEVHETKWWQKNVEVRSLC